MTEPQPVQKGTGVEEPHGAVELSTYSVQDFPSHNTHPDAQWFATTRLGLFATWGISSVHGEIDLSWSMIKNITWDTEYEGKNKVTPREYYQLADKFNPDRYDPDLWLKAAAKAGYKYAVLTTRYHDGYALWPSQFRSLNTRTHMNGRDLVRPCVEACRKNGLMEGKKLTIHLPEAKCSLLDDVVIVEWN